MHSSLAYAMAISINPEQLQGYIATNFRYLLFWCGIFQKHQNIFHVDGKYF